jgi:adenylosuccinate synthase
LIQIVLGLGFGDEGKGSITDWLVRQSGSRLVVRYNGGPQAAHHVVTPDGRSHCFSQLGAGSFVAEVGTLLSRFVAVDPLALERECTVFRHSGGPDLAGRVAMDERCVVVTPYHRAANRLEERSRGDSRHGSTGRGVGQAVLDARDRLAPIVYARVLSSPRRARRVLEQLRLTKLDIAEQHGAVDSPELETLRDRTLSAQLAERYAAAVTPLEVLEASAAAARLRAHSRAVFEGAQGVLLDPDLGFFPHVTPTRTTVANAVALLAEAGYEGPIQRIGVLRAYSTRHGEGPLPTYDSTWSTSLPESDNSDDGWQGDFRRGPFDAVLARYALAAVGGVDQLALTCVDRLRELDRPTMCTAYQGIGPTAWDDLPLPADRTQQCELTALLRRAQPELRPLGGQPVAAIERRLERKVDIVSSGPSAADKSLP